MKHLIPFVKSPPHVAVLRLSGVIAAAGRQGSLSDAALAPVIERAFRKGKPDAVALVINSPGGSPVQSALIAARIRRLAEEKEIPVFAFVEDVAASGGYWLACAADEIWVDPSSVTGSIGVISSGFGFQGLIERHGVDRRVYTAGKSKSMLDPFQAEKPADVKRLRQMLDGIHTVFKDYVTMRRADRLDPSKDLFTGDIWVGQAAIDVGIADHIGHVVPVMKEMYGDKLRFSVHGAKRSIWQRFGAKLIGGALGEIEDRAAYARFGL
ncbi:MAG: S49 family peptidase [Paracoccaceae bacterium]